jgi:hypothetical protein
MKREGGSTLLQTFGGSMQYALKSLYPEHNWNPFKFSSVTKGYWKDIQNQRQFMEYVYNSSSILKLVYDHNHAYQMDMKSMEDWYYISKRDIIRKGGERLLRIYDESLEKLLRGVYPNYNWNNEEFLAKMRGKWTSRKNVQAFVNMIGNRLNLSKDQYHLITREYVFNL